MRDIQRDMGLENFPLIEQSYYPDHRDMVINQLCEMAAKQTFSSLRSLNASFHAYSRLATHMEDWARSRSRLKQHFM